MEIVLFGGASIDDKALMTDRVVADARRFHAGVLDDGLLREWTEAAVDRIWGDGPRVTRYVPMLALREVRARVVATLETRLAVGDTPPEAAGDARRWDVQHVAAAMPAD